VNNYKAQYLVRNNYIKHNIWGFDINQFSILEINSVMKGGV